MVLHCGAGCSLLWRCCADTMPAVAHHGLRMWDIPSLCACLQLNSLLAVLFGHGRPDGLPLVLAASKAAGMPNLRSTCLGCCAHQQMCAAGFCSGQLLLHVDLDYPSIRVSCC